ncbi:GGDEF domain-containing protein [Arsenicicoccus sp. oral taxon 190]|uniref:GGDEF domain-containing protein n=1 Tax=Arsenicicoccus sp. oral taxon 190 TaxID=1658671 RepID=UPI00067CB4D4|nr:GGDEF domain-containing protein [Arsenicicoccus sp. oral taxon 190]
MGRWSAAAALAGWYLLLVAVLLVTELGRIGQDPTHSLRYYLYVGAYTTLLLSSALAMVRYPQRRNYFTMSVLAAWAAYVIGDTVSDIATDTIFASNRQLSDPGDALMLGGYAVLLTGFVRVAHRHRDLVNLDRVIDGAIVAVALGTLVWVSLIMPGMRSPALAQSPLNAVVTSLFPTLDLALVALGFAYLSGQRPVSWAALVGLLSPVLLLVADVLDFVNLMHHRQEPLLAHVCWFLAYGSAAVAMMVPPGAHLWRGSREVAATGHGRRRVPWIFATGLVPVIVYGWQLVRPGEAGGVQDGTTLSIAMLLMFMLVVARAAGMMRTADEQSGDLAVLARSDHLTGLPNRRTADAELARALARAGRTGEPVSVTIVDLDRFKAFNDTYGHHAGDELLSGCAHRWSDLLGPAEVLARYGGEEFVLVTVGLPTSAVIDLVDRLRAVTPRDQTFSAGIAVWRRGDTAAEMLSRADEALYAAKANGRARTYLWQNDGDRSDREPGRGLTPALPGGGDDA